MYNETAYNGCCAAGCTDSHDVIRLADFFHEPTRMLPLWLARPPCPLLPLSLKVTLSYAIYFPAVCESPSATCTDTYITRIITDVPFVHVVVSMYPLFPHTISQRDAFGPVRLEHSPIRFHLFLLPCCRSNAAQAVHAPSRNGLADDDAEQ